MNSIWLIESGDPDYPQYYCGASGWSAGRSNALSFPTEESAKLRASALASSRPVRVVEYFQGYAA